MDRRASAAMRLLPVRPDHAGGLVAVEERQPDQGRSRGSHGRQSLPLHDLFAHPESHHARRHRNAYRLQCRQRAEGHMNSHVKITPTETNRDTLDLSRLSFLIGSAATGLALGYSAIPGLLGADEAFAAAG